jgi:hypothetical protein
VAIAALVLGIIGTLFSLIPGVGYWIGIPLSLVAVILGVVARKNAAANNQPTGSATAGLALGIVGLVVGILMFVACALCMKAANDQAKKFADDPAFKKSMEDFDKAMKDAEKKAKEGQPAQ